MNDDASLDLSADFARVATLERAVAQLRVAVVGNTATAVVFSEEEKQPDADAEALEAVYSSSKTFSPAPRSDTMRRELAAAAAACDALVAAAFVSPLASPESSRTADTKVGVGVGAGAGAGAVAVAGSPTAVGNDTVDSAAPISFPSAASLSKDALALKAKELTRERLIALGIDPFDYGGEDEDEGDKEEEEEEGKDGAE